jgi:hypothetical protein
MARGSRGLKTPRYRRLWVAHQTQKKIQRHFAPGLGCGLPKRSLLDARAIEAHACQFFSTRQLSPAAFSELHTPAAAFLDTKGPIEAW